MPHAGAFYFDTRPMDADWATLNRRLRPLSTDGEPGGHVGPGIALGCVPGVWSEDSPAPVQTRGGVIVAWDGRLDNRDELRLRFGVSDAEGSDAHLAGAALDRLGLDGFHSLIGEWSAAVWDPTRRCLHLARDYAGVRPLYYACGPGWVRWSTDLALLVDWTDRRHTLSDRFAAAFMTGRAHARLTPYDGIHGVEPGTRRSFADPGATVDRFWRLQPRTVRFRDPRDYEERLRELWADAVGGRLRATGTVWAELSGGFDSSSVVCMADRLIRTGAVAATRIRPLSYVAFESRGGDERPYIAEVERQIDETSDVVGVEATRALRDPELEALTPMAIDGVGLAAALRVMANGGRVVLSGRMGDAVMGCEPDNSAAVYDDIGEWRLGAAFAKTRSWSRSARKPFVEIAARLWRGFTARGAARAAFARSASSALAASQLLTPRMRPLIPDLEADVFEAIRHVNPSRRATAATAVMCVMSSLFTKTVYPRGLTFAFPFTHRPLLEYILAIPGEELSAPGELRWLMRRSFDGLLPSRVLARVSKGHYPPAMTRALRDRVTELQPIAALEIVQRGWIEARALDAAIRRLTDGGGRTYGEVWRAWRLEQWLSSRTRRAPAAIPERKEVRSHEVLNA